MTKLSARVEEKDAGRKVKYFVQGDMHVSSGQFRSLKMAGGLLVNNERVHANYPLRAGDLVSVLLEETAQAKDVLPEFAGVRIPYEDADVYIVDKPAPLPCQCSPRQMKGTLENRLRAHYCQDENFLFRPINRLDKGTSGLLAAAKHAHACQRMQAELHSPAYIREYLAVVEGILEEDGSIDLPIAKVEEASVKRCIDFEHGRRACTHYRVEAVSHGRTLLRLRLETGRTHQIRVHLSAIGHPVVGDFLYGREVPELPGRFALHSTYIQFEQPLTAVPIACCSPLPEELLRLMRL